MLAKRVRRTLMDAQIEVDSLFGQSQYVIKDYKGDKAKAVIECQTCSLLFERIPYDFKKSLGCPSCASALKSSSISVAKSKETEKEILGILFQKYANYTFYFKTPFKNRTNSDVNVECITHQYVMTANVKSLLRKDKSIVLSCPRCLQEARRDTLEDYSDKLGAVFPDTFDTSLAIYKDAHSLISVVCNKCHKCLTKKAYQILQGSGCPSCKPKSVEESIIKSYIQTLLPLYNVKSSRPTWMEGKELDIFIPEFNLAIEYNGSIYHHSSNSIYVSNFLKNTSKSKDYHFNKWRLCKENNITLLSIYDFYWSYPIKREIYKSKIRHYLNMDVKIMARKCYILEISNKEAYIFYEKNHLEGKGFGYKDSKSYGLFFDNKLLMCCTIGKFYSQTSKTFKMKLHRIATLLDFTVVGGISKMSKYLERNFGEYDYQITLSTGGSTLHDLRLNFLVIPPRYFWVNSKNISEYYHRNYCQKQVLEQHFNQPLLPDDTENTYMEKLGYIKVYDNGLAKIK
jgi:predicted Zn-ribbon and HTH transcriptional regulator